MRERKRRFLIDAAFTRAHMKDDQAVFPSFVISHLFISDQTGLKVEAVFSQTSLLKHIARA